MTSTVDGLKLQHPGWLKITSLVLSILGLGDAAYLSYEHATGSTTLACSGSGAIDCLKVTTSQWSKLFGVPVAYLGLGFFIAMTVLCLPVVWQKAPRWVDWLRLAMTVVGMVMVFYLVWAEFFKIDSICLWCTGVHILTFLLLIVLVAGEAMSNYVLDEA